MSFFASSSKSNSRPSNPRASSSPSSFFTSSSGARTTSSSKYGSHRGTSSSSYYKRRPRDNFIARLLERIKRMLGDLYRYMRRHPMKIVVPLVMALISGGALTKLAQRFGIRLPPQLAQMVGAGQSVKGGYDAWYGSQDMGGHQGGGGMGGMGGMLGGGGGWMKGAMKVAGAFM